jgi:hypothetical protein
MLKLSHKEGCFGVHVKPNRRKRNYDGAGLSFRPPFSGEFRADMDRPRSGREFRSVHTANETRASDNDKSKKLT